MGVPGLWDLIRPAATRTSLSTLARDSFLSNRNGYRALTIGIDASIWIFHAQIPQHGENPFLRTIFYKITSLLQHPVLPVFVFDGPNKPARKRNERVGGQFGTSDWRSRKFKELLDVCGLEWWNVSARPTVQLKAEAPGEAEAELAVMNRQGKIDAVLSDDVDALLFGATCLLRNNSPTLSGAQASSTQNNSSRSDLRHYEMYRSSAIADLWMSKEKSSLKSEEDCRLAMVLTALLGGGDYAPEGLAGFGPTITHGLAQAGYAEFLKHYGSSRFAKDRNGIVSSIIDELRTNSSGHIGRRYPARAKDLEGKDAASLFPDFALEAYLKPATSPLDDPELGWPGFGHGEANSSRGKARNTGKGDMEGMALACEKYFEWGTKDIVGRKFGSENVGVFAGQILNDARESMWTRSMRPKSPSPTRKSDTSSPSRITAFFSQMAPIASSSKTPAQTANFSSGIQRPPAHILKIHSSRKDPLNAELTEYRVSYDPTHFVARCHSAMAGTRCDPKDLDLEDRERLGLVDRGGGADEEDSPPPMPTSTQVAAAESGKKELRVWMPEYLLQEAWPALLTSYEESLKARADKAKSPKKRVKTKLVKGVTAAESTKFRNFFTATQPQSRPQAVESSTDEEIEVIEDRRYASSPKKNARPHPGTSSLSSLSSSLRSKSPPLLLPASPAIGSGRRLSANRSKSISRDTSASAPPSAGTQASSMPRGVARSPSATAVARPATSRTSSSKEVIDLCSSSDESASPHTTTSHRPARRAAAVTARSRTSLVLATSPKPNLPAVAQSTKPATRPSGNPAKGKAPAKSSVAAPLSQSVLGLPVVAGPSRSSPKRADPKVTVVERTKGRRGKNVSMVVVYEDDEVEVIDSTRGVWRASQSPGLARLRG